MDIRALTPADEAALEAFLIEHRDSSMFLRSGVRRGNLAQAVYAGAFLDGRLVGVVSHGLSGVVLVQAPKFLPDLARACVAWSARAVTGLSGPRAQVHETRTLLELDTADVLLQSDEGLYALALADFRVPEALSAGGVACRAPRPDERDTLCAWRLAYDLEAIGATDTPAQRARATAALDAQIASGNAWVAVENDRPVSLAAFNAALPDIVQLGGIYTPPELRGRGFAKVAVAGSLLAAQDRGASRAVLFTNNPSAVRAYEALGFRLVGDYSVVLFKS